MQLSKYLLSFLFIFSLTTLSISASNQKRIKIEDYSPQPQEIIKGSRLDDFEYKLKLDSNFIVI